MLKRSLHCPGLWWACRCVVVIQLWWTPGCICTWFFFPAFYLKKKTCRQQNDNDKGCPLFLETSQNFRKETILKMWRHYPLIPLIVKGNDWGIFEVLGDFPFLSDYFMQLKQLVHKGPCLPVLNSWQISQSLIKGWYNFRWVINWDLQQTFRDLNVKRWRVAQHARPDTPGSSPCQWSVFIVHVWALRRGQER